MNISKIFSALFAALMLACAIPTAATAASLDITPAIKSSLDKVIAAADGTQAGKISAQHNELLSLLQQAGDWDGKIGALHTGNKDTLSVLSKQVREIDAGNLQKLEDSVLQTKERYKPLFSSYTALNKQIEAARLLNNKTLNMLLRLQANSLKIPVTLARVDIKAKEHAWKTAKDSAATSMKKIRTTLADIDPINQQIKDKQSAIKAIDTSRTPLWNSFKQAVKKGDATSVLNTLTSMVSLSRQITEEKQKVFTLETKIRNIHAVAKAQMPKT